MLRRSLTRQSVKREEPVGGSESVSSSHHNIGRPCYFDTKSKKEGVALFQTSYCGIGYRFPFSAGDKDEGKAN